MEKELSGKEVAQHIGNSLKEPVTVLKAQGIVPCLAIIRVGERPDDLAYERSAKKRLESYDIEVRTVCLAENATQEMLEKTLQALNEDDSVHGILIFQPLPKHLSAEPLKTLIHPKKDVDGLSPINMAKVYANEPDAMAPCTPVAVMEILSYYGIELIGKRVTVVGRSMVVGRPLAMLLLHQHATVTICHTKTEALAARCREAEVLVAACGRPKMIGADMIGDGAIVIDVGIHVDENGKLCGDVDASEVTETASALTPVPGGVGSVTTSVLAKHVVQAAARLNHIDI